MVLSDVRLLASLSNLFISRQTFRDICTKTNIFQARVFSPSSIHFCGCTVYTTQSSFIRSFFSSILAVIDHPNVTSSAVNQSS
jgi:hypothetical protein